MKKTKQPSYPSAFEVEDDMDYTNPYPCMVCGKEFRSRRLLATHPHGVKK